MNILPPPHRDHIPADEIGEMLGRAAAEEIACFTQGASPDEIAEVLGAMRSGPSLAEVLRVQEQLRLQGQLDAGEVALKKQSSGSSCSTRAPRTQDTITSFNLRAATQDTMPPLDLRQATQASLVSLELGAATFDDLLRVQEEEEEEEEGDMIEMLELAAAEEVAQSLQGASPRSVSATLGAMRKGPRLTEVLKIMEAPEPNLPFRPYATFDLLPFRRSGMNMRATQSMP